jgi:hypothetical protein
MPRSRWHRDAHVGDIPQIAVTDGRDRPTCCGRITDLYWTVAPGHEKYERGPRDRPADLERSGIPCLYRSAASRIGEPARTTTVSPKNCSLTEVLDDLLVDAVHVHAALGAAIPWPAISATAPGLTGGEKPLAPRRTADTRDSIFSPAAAHVTGGAVWPSGVGFGAVADRVGESAQTAVFVFRQPGRSSPNLVMSRSRRCPSKRQAPKRG